MKLACSVSIGNRLLPALAINSKQKHVKSTLVLCKQPKSEKYCILHFTSQNKSGTKYKIKENISQILTRFINDGKATIQFKNPPHDLYVHSSDIIQLKGFLHLLKLVLENKITSKDIRCSSMSVTANPGKDVPPKKLIIKSRGEYPIRGFPRTLEALYINNINRCSLDKGILQLTRLKILDLSQNCIEFIPEGLSILHLRELNLSSNKLDKSAPNQWEWINGNLAQSLVLLNLEGNRLKYLSNNIVRLQKLVTLNVNNNELTMLPKGIGCLKNLKILLASNNSISILPGSIKKCILQQLNLYNNNFCPNQSNLQVPHPSHLPVRSLKECAARVVLKSRIPYSPAIIPFTLVNYLDNNSNYCVCGNACFEVFIRATETLSIINIAQECITSRETFFLTLDCYFCSLECFRSSHFTRSRNPVI